MNINEAITFEKTKEKHLVTALVNQCQIGINVRDNINQLDKIADTWMSLGRTNDANKLYKISNMLERKIK